MSFNDSMIRFMSVFPEDALTFDDVSLVTQYSDFLPSATDLTTQLSRRIALNIPFLSAAMDTVTEARMAIAMAMLGGIGIIHKNLSAAEQSDMVATVKHHLHGLIAKPVTFRHTMTLRQVREACVAKGYTFSGFPIVDDKKRLVGILTSRDVRFSKDPNARIDTVMTRRVITAPPATTQEQAYRIMQRRKIGKLPLVYNGKLVGLTTKGVYVFDPEKSELVHTAAAPVPVSCGFALADGAVYFGSKAELWRYSLPALSPTK